MEPPKVPHLSVSPDDWFEQTYQVSRANEAARQVFSSSSSSQRKLAATDEQKPHGSGSQATLVTPLYYRVIWTIDQQSDLKDQPLFLDFSFEEDRGCQETIRMQTKDLLHLFLGRIHKSGEKFPTSDDIRVLRQNTDTAVLASFLAFMQEINRSGSNNSPSTGDMEMNSITVDSDLLLSMPASEFKRKRAKTTLTSKMNEEPAGRIPQTSYSSTQSLCYRMKDMKIDEIDDTGELEHKWAHNDEQNTVKEFQRIDDDPVPRTDKSQYNYAFPPLRTTHSEDNILVTGTALLTEMCFQVSALQDYDPQRTLHASPAKEGFRFCDAMGMKLWEARVDGVLLMREPGVGEVVQGLIEAKNFKRTDLVRCQETAEIVAFVRSTAIAREKTGSPMSTYLIGINGSEAFIIVAEWSQSYIEFLKRVSEKANRNMKGEIVGPEAPKEVGEDLLDKDGFLRLTEFGPFSLDDAGSMEAFFVNGMYLMDHFLKKE